MNRNVIKKILLALLIGILCTLMFLGLTGCDGYNKQIFDTKYSFDKAHLISGDKCVSIKKWANYDDGDMVQIILDDSSESVVLGHSNEIILIKGKCPYCGK